MELKTDHILQLMARNFLRKQNIQYLLVHDTDWYH